VIVFSLKYRREKRVFVISNVINSMGEEASIDSMQIPDPQPPIFLGLADNVPRAKSNRRGRIVVLNTRPPKPSNDGIDFFHKGLGEKNSGHIVNWDRSKDRLYVGEPIGCLG